MIWEPNGFGKAGLVLCWLYSLRSGVSHAFNFPPWFSIGPFGNTSFIVCKFVWLPVCVAASLVAKVFRAYKGGPSYFWHLAVLGASTYTVDIQFDMHIHTVYIYIYKQVHAPFAVVVCTEVCRFLKSFISICNAKVIFCQPSAIRISRTVLDGSVFEHRTSSS